MLPSSLQGAALTKSTLIHSIFHPDQARKASFSPLGKKLLSEPGALRNLIDHLNGPGAKDVPKIVANATKGQLLSKPLQLLSKTQLGRNLVINKILDQTAPKIYGTRDIAKQYLLAGGNV